MTVVDLDTHRREKIGGRETHMHEWPHEEALRLDAAVSYLATAQSHLDPLMGLMAVARLSEIILELATELAMIASRAGYTNKRIANALGVPPATLRGLQDEARA